jgi:L-lactate dehydrogenase (cytochrome)
VIDIILGRRFIKYLARMVDQKLLSTQQVSEHKTPEDCWIVVDNQVWDVSDFLDEHPGGSTSTNQYSLLN